MCLLWGKNWVFIAQKTAYFIVTAVKTSNLTWKITDGKYVTVSKKDTYFKRFRAGIKYLLTFYCKTLVCEYRTFMTYIYKLHLTVLTDTHIQK
jgi:hypothetical protein